MVVAVVRHAKVDIEWDFLQTSAEFDRLCDLYDTAPVLPVTVTLPETEFKRVYVSALSRTHATARQVVGQREFTKTALINEVRERSGFDTKVKLPKFVWEVISKIQWIRGTERQPESHADTVRRAEKFVDRLILRNEDCAVFTHGFFMITLLQVMKTKGFEIDHTRLNYSNGECVVCTKNAK